MLTQSSGGNGEVQNPFLFQGGIKDRATGWVHFGARWYNPSTGRWTQQDTLDAPLDPTNANRYAFAGNDPVNNTDPVGTIHVPESDQSVHHEHRAGCRRVRRPGSYRRSGNTARRGGDCVDFACLRNRAYRLLRWRCS